MVKTTSFAEFICSAGHFFIWLFLINLLLFLVKQDALSRTSLPGLPYVHREAQIIDGMELLRPAGHE